MDFFDNIGSFLLRVVGLLPDSFINEYLTGNNFEFLSFLNWVIPFYDFKVISELWIVAMGSLFAGRVALSMGSALSKIFKRG